MKIKTEQEIVEISNTWGGYYLSTNRFHRDQVKQFIIEFYRQAQSDLIESASEGMVDAIEKVNEIDFEGDFERYKAHWRTEVELWEECSLHHAKLIKEKDERIKELKDSVANLEFLLEGWQKDYKEAVKDIENVLFHLTKMMSGYDYVQWCNASLASDRVKSKYGLDKQGRK